MTGRTLEWRTSTHFSTVRRLPLLPDTTHPPTPPRRTKVHHFPTLPPSLELAEANVSQALAAGVVGSTVRHRGGGQARKLTCHNKVPTAPSPPSRASLDFSSAKGTLKVWLLLFFLTSSKSALFLSVLFFSLSLVRARVYVSARACTSTGAQCQRAVCYTHTHTPTPSHPHLAALPPGPAAVILTDSDAHISVVSPLSEGVSSAGEDELENVLSDVDEVPKSKKKKKAKKSSRDSKSSKRQRPAREVCACVSACVWRFLAFYFEMWLCGHCFGNSPTWVRKHPPKNRHNKMKSVLASVCVLFIST